MDRSGRQDIRIFRGVDRGRIAPSDDTGLGGSPQIEIEIDVEAIAAEVEMLRESRRRMRDAVRGNDRRSGLITGGSFVVAVTAWNFFAPPRGWSVATFAACVAMYIVAASVLALGLAPGGPRGVRGALGVGLSALVAVAAMWCALRIVSAPVAHPVFVFS